MNSQTGLHLQLTDESLCAVLLQFALNLVISEGFID